MPNRLIFYLIAVGLNLTGMLLIYSLMAYTIVRLRWRRRGVIGVLTTIILAEIFWIAPAMIGFEGGIDGGTALGSLGFGNWLVSAFGIALFCRQAKDIPRQLEDSARLDGCGWFGTYWHVLLPLVRRELALIALLTLTATALPYWAALTAASPFPLGPSLEVLLGLGRFSQNGIGAVAGIVFASFVMTLPVLLIFLLARYYLDERSIRHA